MSMRRKINSKRKTFDNYLAALPPDQRSALEKLRKAIHAAAPELEECIGYGVPAFRLNGRFLVAMAAASRHCSFYPGSALQEFKLNLKKYDPGKGPIRFQPHEP